MPARMTESDLNSRVYCVSWRAVARSARKADEPMSSSEAASARCAVAAMTGSSAAKHALAVGLAERDEPHAGGDPVGGERLQKGRERGRERDAVAGGGGRDRDRIGDRAVPDGLQPVERGARPGGARRLDEGVALRGRFQMALLGRRERGGEFGDAAQRLVVFAARLRGGRARTAPRRRSRRLRPASTASQPRSVPASLMSPASTAHSMPLE